MDHKETIDYDQQAPPRYEDDDHAAGAVIADVGANATLKGVVFTFSHRFLLH